LIKAAPIVVSTNIVDILSSMLSESLELANNLFTFFIKRKAHCSRAITSIDGDVPVEGWAAFLSPEL
jgi:hypothetical protein